MSSIFIGTDLTLNVVLFEIDSMYHFRNCLSLYLMRMILPLFLYFVADCWFYLSEKKCIKSQEYASEHGLPNLEHVLLPKTKGFICCLQELRSSLDAGERPFPLLVPCTHDTFAAMMLCGTVAQGFLPFGFSAESLWTNNCQPTTEIQLLGIISYIFITLMLIVKKYILNLFQTVILWSIL